MSLYVNFGVPRALFPVSTPPPHTLHFNSAGVFLNSTLQREPYGCTSGSVKKPTNQHKESERQGESCHTFFTKRKNDFTLIS